MKYKYMDNMLEKGILLGFKEEVIEGIGVHVNRRGARSHETRPLPSVIFGI